MDISDKLPIQRPAGAKSVQPVQKTRPAKKTATRPAARGDRVQISNKAREMQAARQAIKQMPEVDSEKVAKIKAQLRDGTYKVDGRKAAEKMLAESLMMER